jgi:anti-anti-sigma factor
VTLHVDCRKTEGIIILDLAGDLTIGPGHARLCDEVTSLMRAGFSKIILNLQRVAKIDAAGLGALALVLIQCRTLREAKQSSCTSTVQISTVPTSSNWMQNSRSSMMSRTQ